MSKTKVKPVNLELVGRTVAAHLKKSDDNFAKADQHARSAGLMVKSAFDEIDRINPTGHKKGVINKSKWIKDHDLNRSQVYICLAIVDGRLDLAKVKADAAERQRKAIEAKVEKALAAAKADVETPEPAPKGKKGRGAVVPVENVPLKDVLHAPEVFAGKLAEAMDFAEHNTSDEVGEAMLANDVTVAAMKAFAKYVKSLADYMAKG